MYIKPNSWKYFESYFFGKLPEISQVIFAAFVLIFVRFLRKKVFVGSVSNHFATGCSLSYAERL